MTTTCTISGRMDAGRATRRGFTLTELIVAIGATALLMIGIAQVFASVSRVVGSGSAVAELDQLARAVERQLREDFSSLSQMRADETFMAIRSRKLG
ncbi:MAG TPA: prepilin-type N-terminal cleavage/methylation domain-containing protein, partial [Phycisphaerales bacterium]|nr:prepilin-type N-terminal cleavage/methylation domain-containing protein [Phycisphaerales bacterium]